MLVTASWHIVAPNTRAENKPKGNSTSIVHKPPSTNTTVPTWMHKGQVKHYRLLPGHHCESASLSPALSPLYSSLASPLQVKPGSKNSSELNSHNNMRLSGDRRNTVCAGQYRGGNSTESGPLTARKRCDKRVTVGTCSSVVSESRSFFFPLSLIHQLSLSFSN